ncbi:hypothetical protein H5410_048187 [Solanum commersonii]|uniref:Uncharacterized protein n=1 Tax=Solanum commersonii TaxID=4109 RepID=A0A9J5XHD3_SOLCO|nr:hypothetical protein H5410_048187 [Solanum commersonii]
MSSEVIGGSVGLEVVIHTDDPRSIPPQCLRVGARRTAVAVLSCVIKEGIELVSQQAYSSEKAHLSSDPRTTTD